MKQKILFWLLITTPFFAKSTIHEIKIWDGYMEFLPASLEIQLGDTIQWLPLLVAPSMVHTITSSNIPVGAVSFDEIHQAPADTFFQYIPAVAGLYEYVCTPHILNGMIGSFNVVQGTAAISKTIENDFTIYPNPASDILFLRTSETETRYKIWTQVGKQVEEGMVTGKIDVSRLSKGNYFIEILGDRPRVFSFFKK